MPVRDYTLDPTGRPFHSIALAPRRVFFDMGNDSPAPAPDPAIGQAALANAETAKAQLQIGEDQLAWNKERYAQEAPTLKRAADQQLAAGDQALAQATEQWKRYQELYEPVEAQNVKDAMAYGTPDDQEAAAAGARADVASSFEGQRAATDRDLARSGVNINPASESSIARRVDSGNTEAAAGAGASNTARINSRLQGIALRQGVAQFGRNMPATGIAATGAGVGATSAGVGTINAQTGSYNAGVNSASPWYSGSVASNTAAGNLYLGQYNAQLQGYNTQQQADSASGAAMGKLVGAGITAFAMSSKALKEKRRGVSLQSVLARIGTLPVEKWKYKPGVSDEGEHVGPYAEDVNKRFGDTAAPGGKMIDLISMNGIALAGVKALLERVQNLEAKTEPEREEATA